VTGNRGTPPCAGRWPPGDQRCRPRHGRRRLLRDHHPLRRGGMAVSGLRWGCLPSHRRRPRPFCSKGPLLRVW